MVLLEMHATLDDRQIAVGQGDSFVQAANHLKRILQRRHPELLKLDLENVIKALQNEHYCEVVGTRSNTGMFIVLRVNRYKARPSIWRRVMQALNN